MRSASDKLIRKMKTMKTLLLCCILLTAATARTAAQSIEPRVSEEVELMSADTLRPGFVKTRGGEKYPPAPPICITANANVIPWQQYW